MNSGNVGIGTTSPDDKLDVEGNFRVTDGHIRVFTTSGTAGFINGLGNAKMSLGTENGSTLVIDRGNESVAIGTTNIPTGYKLAVDGKIIIEEVKVKLSSTWPDYVFEPDYNLPSLASVKKFVESEKHLPEIPPAEEMEKEGLELGNMNMLLLKKIEELTLYVIDLKEENEAQQREIEKLKGD